jgi:hypothetical protein
VDISACMPTSNPEIPDAENAIANEYRAVIRQLVKLRLSGATMRVALVLIDYASASDEGISKPVASHRIAKAAGVSVATAERAISTLRDLGTISTLNKGRLGLQYKIIIQRPMNNRPHRRLIPRRRPILIPRK